MAGADPRNDGGDPAPWAAGTPVMTGPRSHWQRPPARVDCAVVGGGIAGVSVLRCLLERGLAAVLLEARWCGFGATGRNAGFIDGASWYRRSGDPDEVGAIAELARINHAHLAEALAGHDVGYLQRGAWMLAVDATEAAEVEAAVERARGASIGATYHRTLPDRLRGYHSGGLFPDGGEVHSLRALRRLAAPWAEAIYPGFAVVGLGAHAHGVTVAGPEGELEADQVVLATNAYTPRLAPDVPIAAVRGQILAAGPLPPGTLDRPAGADHGWQYWRQAADGHVLVGGYRDRALLEEVGFGLEPTARVQEHLDAHLRRLGLAAPVVARWAGTMGFTPDGLPLVGTLPGRPRIHVVAGFNGGGMGLAFESARLLAAQLVDGVAPPAWLRPERFPSGTAPPHAARPHEAQPPPVAPEAPGR